RRERHAPVQRLVLRRVPHDVLHTAGAGIRRPVAGWRSIDGEEEKERAVGRKRGGRQAREGDPAEKGELDAAPHRPFERPSAGRAAEPGAAVAAGREPEARPRERCCLVGPFPAAGYLAHPPPPRRARRCAARRRRWRDAAPPPPPRPGWRRGAAAGRTPGGRARPCSPTADPAGEQAVRLGLLRVVRARPEEVEVA